jgi:two-component system LytT family sensor kinase
VPGSRLSQTSASPLGVRKCCVAVGKRQYYRIALTRYNSADMRAPNFSKHRVAGAYALSLLVWLSAAPLISWQMFMLERKEHLPVVYHDLLFVYGARYLTVALLTPPIFYFVNRWPVTGGAALRRSWIYVLGYLPFSLAFALIRWLLLPPWMEETLSFGPRTLDSLIQLTYGTFADVLFLYLSVVVCAHAYAYFVLGQRQEIERLELRQSLAQSELQTLRAQLHPHFLFNTLQGLSTLINTDRQTAQTMLFTLAELLRTVLRHGTADLVSVREELDFLKAYLYLEKLRLGRRLEVRWRISPEVHDAFIPQLLLQPLIENAIVHGVSSSPGPGWVQIEASTLDERLRVVIRNSIGGVSEPGSGVGIPNTKARLRYLYGEDASFEFEVLGGEAAAAHITIPAFRTPVENGAASHEETLRCGSLLSMTSR